MKSGIRSAEEAERRRDLAFIVELRKASLFRLEQIALNLSYVGPEWQRIAVERELARRDGTA